MFCSPNKKLNIPHSNLFIVLINHVLCFIGFHSWQYENDKRIRRVCTWCRESQSWFEIDGTWSKDISIKEGKLNE